MGNIISPFSIPIIQDVISEESYLTIKEDVFKYLFNNKLEPSWNCPTKSSYSLPIKNSFTSKNVEKEIKNITNKYIEEWKFLKPPKLKIQKIWVNVAEQHSFQEYHSHIEFPSNNLFSGVLYIDANKHSGNLSLVNPLENMIYSLPSSLKITPNISISPYPRLIVSFPSFLGHYVGENKNKTDRISISWNIEINK